MITKLKSNLWYSEPSEEAKEQIRDELWSLMWISLSLIAIAGRVVLWL